MLASDRGIRSSMNIKKRVKALETSSHNGSPSVIVRYAGDDFTEADKAEMERARKIRIPPMIIVINRPKPKAT